MSDQEEKRIPTPEETEGKRRELRENFTMDGVVVRGVVELFVPMRSKSDDVHALHYDFSTLTGNDMVECLDSDPGANNDNGVTSRQAMALFCRACKRAEHAISGLDEIDIRRQLSGQDMVTAVRIGKSFFAHALAGALLSISRMP